MFKDRTIRVDKSLVLMRKRQLFFVVPLAVSIVCISFAFGLVATFQLNPIEPVYAAELCQGCEVVAPPELKTVDQNQNFASGLLDRFREPEQKKPKVFDGIFLLDIKKDRNAVSVSSVDTGFNPYLNRGLSIASSSAPLVFETFMGNQPYVVNVSASSTPQPLPTPPPNAAVVGISVAGGPVNYGGVYGGSTSPSPFPSDSPNMYLSTTYTPVAGYTPATSFKESMGILRQNASKFSIEEKMYILNRLGSALGSGYDRSVAGGNAFGSTKTSFEQMFQNFREGGTRGGVCRDISSYIAEAARALGFESVGTHTGLAGQDQKAGAHVVAHYKDPATGEYYMQNYETIFNTHQKTLQGSVDVSTRAMGALTGVSYVESLPGKVHQYVPKLARWTQDQLNSFANKQEDPAYVTAKIGNNETTLGLQYQVQDKTDAKAAERMVKGFFLSSSVDTPEGPVQMQAIGVSGEVEKNKKLSQSVLSEVGYAAKGQFGYLQVRVPDIIQDSGKSEQKRSNIFLGVNVAGKAKINQLTGKLEFDAKILDLWTKDTLGAPLSGVSNKLTPSVEYEIAGTPVKLGASRTLEAIPADQYSKLKVQTAYDKLSVVIDRRGDKDKVAIVSNSEAYLFGGVENRDAVALRQLFSVAIPTEKRGEFDIVMDLSKIVENQSKDPFYDLPVNAKMRVQWKKALSKLIEIGTGVEANYGNQPFFLFETPGSVTPELAAPKKRELKGDLWMRMQF